MKQEHHSFALACFVLSLLLGVMYFVATPARSQEPPAGIPCGPADKVQKSLEDRYGEGVVGGGIVNSDIVIITANPKTHTFTVLVRRADGQACLLVGGEGFAIADPAGMMGDKM